MLLQVSSLLRTPVDSVDALGMVVQDGLEIGFAQRVELAVRDSAHGSSAAVAVQHRDLAKERARLQSRDDPPVARHDLGLAVDQEIHLLSYIAFANNDGTRRGRTVLERAGDLGDELRHTGAGSEERHLGQQMLPDVRNVLGVCHNAGRAMVRPHGMVQHGLIETTEYHCIKRARRRRALPAEQEANLTEVPTCVHNCNDVSIFGQLDFATEDNKQIVSLLPSMEDVLSR
mmetsp:Transcript_30688/g.70736  ORF Transcript_30688/g.70736 Transcript_30688/m.70736 type:complete len:230 (+) Transcript_30688:1179-1868(+)